MDASKVMRRFLSRSSCLTAEDIFIQPPGKDKVDADLETDSVDDAATTDTDKATEDAANILRKIGDEIQSKYDEKDDSLLSGSIDSFINSFVKEQTYDYFSRGVEKLLELCQNDILGTDEKQVAFVMFMVQKAAEAFKNGGTDPSEKKPLIRKSIIIGEMFIKHMKLFLDQEATNT